MNGSILSRVEVIMKNVRHLRQISHCIFGGFAFSVFSSQRLTFIEPRDYRWFTLSQKRTRPIGVILLSEYHANSIRLRRVLLLRSDIRLTPSDIRYASLMANRISLKPQGFNITGRRAISLFAKQRI